LNNVLRILVTGLVAHWNTCATLYSYSVISHVISCLSLYNSYQSNCISRDQL